MSSHSSRSTLASGVADKVAFLSKPESYQPRPDQVAVRETRMSYVFIAGDQVLKLKKPLNDRTLDLRTLAARRKIVRDEVRLNRRLAPEVYLGARPLKLMADGRLSLGVNGRTVDWLVEMRRLPAGLALDARIVEGTVGPAEIARIAGLLGGFWRRLPAVDMEPAEYLSRFERQHAISVGVLDDPGTALDRGLVGLALNGFDAALACARKPVLRRVTEGLLREGHGDLRPEHVFLTDPPVVIDCLEFSRDLRIVDPFDEIVFLGMECARLGADWIPAVLANAVMDALDDHPPIDVLDFYWRYRALLRARQAILHLSEKPVRTPDKWLPQAESYLRLAVEGVVRLRQPGGQ